MKSIEITATVESIEQAQALLESGVDVLYFGEEQFALRLPTYFSREEQIKLVELARKYRKKVTVAVNGIMHPEKMRLIPEYLAFLEGLKVDQIAVGDTGVIFVLQRDGYQLPYIYDAQMLVTSSRQINFWAKRGATGAVLAREVPYLELKEMAGEIEVEGEILVYGATCIHQSKRPLVDNYFAYTKAQDQTNKERGLFLAEPKKGDTHYSIYEDSHGTHIFADNDLNLMMELGKLAELSYGRWKLEGIYTPGQTFVEIAKLFVEAKEALLAGNWTEQLALGLSAKVAELHPVGRGLDTGFFLMDPDEVK